MAKGRDLLRYPRWRRCRSTAEIYRQPYALRTHPAAEAACFSNRAWNVRGSSAQVAAQCPPVLSKQEDRELIHSQPNLRLALFSLHRFSSSFLFLFSTNHSPLHSLFFHTGATCADENQVCSGVPTLQTRLPRRLSITRPKNPASSPPHTRRRLRTRSPTTS